jgi:hypothetical protein
MVCAGPGVKETVGGVGVGVTGSVPGCVHPAARTNIVKSTNTDTITIFFFIPDNIPSAYFMFLFLQSGKSIGMIQNILNFPDCYKENQPIIPFGAF